MRGVGKMDGEGAPADGDAEVAPLCGVAGVSCEMAGIGDDVDVTVTGIWTAIAGVSGLFMISSLPISENHS